MDIEAKVRLIEIVSRRVVQDLLAGEYRSVFKGAGIEFDEVRPYQPGDEVRSIDWNVTARTGKAHIKRYVEERELNLFILLDISASGSFGSCGKTKNEVAAEIFALLAFSAIRNNDRVGLILFSDRIELFLPPAKGVRHVLGMIERVLEFEPKGSGTDIASALNHFGHIARKTSVVFLLSDFQDSGFEDEMQAVAFRHDLIAVDILDRSELSLPSCGLLELRDAESGRRVVCDTDNANLRRRVEEHARSRLDAFDEKLSGIGVDRIRIFTDEDHVDCLARFFRARERRLTGEVMR